MTTETSAVVSFPWKPNASRTSITYKHRHKVAAVKGTVSLVIRSLTFAEQR